MDEEEINDLLWDIEVKCWVKRKSMTIKAIQKIIKEARRAKTEETLELLNTHFEARKQQAEKLGGKYNLGRSVGIGECIRIITKEMSKK